jgi:hypothetical protein
MSHPFLLVFHFPPESPLTSADIEDDIAEVFRNSNDDGNADHLVDGNEIGDAIDIFIFTRDPNAAIRLCKPLLENMGLLDTMIAAFREVDGEGFVVIHPTGYQGKFSL